MTDTTTDSTAAGSGARHGADVVFAYLCALLVLGLFAQLLLAGYGVFDLHGQELDKANSFDAHAALGHILGVVALLMFIAALVSRTSKFAIWASLALVVIIEVVQSVLASGGDDHPWVGGLHALDGGIILVLTLMLHLRSRGALHRSR